MMMRRSTIGWTAVVLAAVMSQLIACDDKSGLVDENYKGEPLAVINGALSIDAPAGGEKISIAVAWITDSSDDDVSLTPDFVGDDETEVACDGTPAPYQTKTYRSNGTKVWALQSVEYEATSLVSFTLPILDLPPESARVHLTALNEREDWIAIGILIAFLDKNGDGKFNPASPDAEGDTLLAVSYQKTDESIYEGAVIYLDGTFSKEIYIQGVFRGLSQGFNIQVYEGDVVIDEKYFTTNMTQTIRMFTPGPIIDYVTIDLQCSEIEHIVDFNKSLSRDDYSDFLECSTSAAEMENSDGTVEEGPISVWWSDGIVDPDDICVVRESVGFNCYPADTVFNDLSWVCGSSFADISDSSDSNSDNSGSSSEEDTETSAAGK